MDEYISDILASVRAKGVSLWSTNGQLHFKAPKGVLTATEIERLKTAKQGLIALLEKDMGSEPAEHMLRPRAQYEWASLSFSQLVHWQCIQSGERRPLRHLSFAVRLTGALNLSALQISIAEMVRRHDALRTQIVLRNGVPTQKISEFSGWQLDIDDLKSLPAGLQDAEVHRTIRRLILEPLDIANDPLFAARLMRLGKEDHILVVAMEHLISDGFSKAILLRDLFTAYAQASRGDVISLPALPVQFADYADWQIRTHSLWIEKHGAYWQERLVGCERVRFPENLDPRAGARSGWSSVPLKIGRELKKELRDWCRIRKTTLVMGMFTAYAATVLRWCNVPDCVVLYQSDGRFRSEVLDSVGFFASTLYLRVELGDQDNFIDLLNRYTQEYCKAHEHSDGSFQEAQTPRPGFTRNTCFNWVSKGPASGSLHSTPSEYPISCSPVEFENPVLEHVELDMEPLVVLYDTDDEIFGAVCFPLSRYSVGTMERFARNFFLCLERLLRRPEMAVKDIALL